MFSQSKSSRLCGIAVTLCVLVLFSSISAALAKSIASYKLRLDHVDLVRVGVAVADMPLPSPPLPPRLRDRALMNMLAASTDEGHATSDAAHTAAASSVSHSHSSSAAYASSEAATPTPTPFFLSSSSSETAVHPGSSAHASSSNSSDSSVTIHSSSSNSSGSRSASDSSNSSSSGSGWSSSSSSSSSRSASDSSNSSSSGSGWSSSSSSSSRSASDSSNSSSSGSGWSSSSSSSSSRSASDSSKSSSSGSGWSSSSSSSSNGFVSSSSDSTIIFTGVVTRRLTVVCSGVAQHSVVQIIKTFCAKKGADATVTRVDGDGEVKSEKDHLRRVAALVSAAGSDNHRNFVSVTTDGAVLDAFVRAANDGRIEGIVLVEEWPERNTKAGKAWIAGLVIGIAASVVAEVLIVIQVVFSRQHRRERSSAYTSAGGYEDLEMQHAHSYGGGNTSVPPVAPSLPLRDRRAQW